MKVFAKNFIANGLLLCGTVLSGWSAEKVTCKVEMDREVVLAGRKQTAIVKVTLDAPLAPKVDERPPVNFVDRARSFRFHVGSENRKSQTGGD